jgi:hypothetical protein
VELRAVHSHRSLRRMVTEAVLLNRGSPSSCGVRIGPA